MSLDEMSQPDTGSLQVLEPRRNPEQECSLKEARLLLAKAMDRLGPRYGEVLHMFHVQELSAKEAARILGVPVGTVKARLHRARSRLAKHLGPMLVRRKGYSPIRNDCKAVRESSEALLAI